MPVNKPKHSCPETEMFFFQLFSLSSMAGLSASLSCTNLCAGTTVYGLKHWLEAEDFIWVKNNLVPKNKLYF